MANPLLLLLLSLGAAPAPLLVDLDEALAKLQRAVQEPDLAARAAALAVVVELADPKAASDLVAEHVRTRTVLHQARGDAFRRRYNLEQRERMLALLERRLAQDPSLEASIADQRKALAEQRDSLAKAEARIEVEAPWSELLAGRIADFAGGLSAGARRGFEADLLERARQEGDVDRRRAAIELLGAVGSPGTAKTLHGLMAELAARRSASSKELPGEMKRVHQVEERMQREAEASGGSVSRSTEQEYRMVKQTATRLRGQITELMELADTCVEAGRAALAREEPAVQRRSVQALARGLRQARDGTRLATLRMLAGLPSETARVEIHALLEKEKDPAAIGAILLESAELRDPVIEGLLIERYLAHASWHVQAQAARALARMRSKAAVGPMIDALAGAEGRLRTDLREALASLTGQDFRTNVELWRRWWIDAEETFEVVPQEAGHATSRGAEDSIGVTFFGVQTDSQRVLFVLDLSGSMNFSMIPRDNPTDERDRPHDMPREGEISRLVAAKRALQTALGGLRDGALFGVVLYASDVFSLTDDLVEMNVKARAEVQDSVEALNAVGGTNIYGALEHAFDLAGADAGTGDAWSKPAVDTIFFLSDGRASVGQTTDPDEILAYVRERNRSAGIVLHTIGLSGAQDAYLMRSLAEQNGGTYIDQ